MDMCMIDVSHIPEVRIGDEVILFGGQGDQYIHIDEIAKKAQTICHEIMGGVSSRVPRDYIKSCEGLSFLSPKQTMFKISDYQVQP